jgi:hypothetical protein
MVPREIGVGVWNKFCRFRVGSDDQVLMYGSALSDYINDRNLLRSWATGSTDVQETPSVMIVCMQVDFSFHQVLSDMKPVLRSRS